MKRSRPGARADDGTGRSRLSRRKLLGLVAAAGATGMGVTFGLEKSVAAAARQIVIAQGADPETLDPQGTTTRSTLNVSGAVCEPLTKVRFAESGKPLLAPVLATSWKMMSDTVWQFKIREGVTFSNGERLDAGAVKFSLERIMDPSNKWPTLTYVRDVAGVAAADPVTVNVTLKRPDPTLPWKFTQTYIVPPKYVAEVGKQAFAGKPVGTGPFTFVEWVKDDHVTLRAAPQYWGGRPKLDQVTFRPIPEGATRGAAIVAGQVDVATPISISEMVMVRHSPNVTVENAPSMRVMYVVLDQATDKIMKDQRVRQALNYAVNKDAIVEHIAQGYGTPLQGQGLAPQYLGFNSRTKPYPYDPKKARQLLSDAGYPNGFSTTMWTTRGRYALDFETAQAVAGQLADVGIKVAVQALEWPVFIRDFVQKRLTPMFLTAWATYPDADQMFEAFHTGGVYSYASLPPFDQMLERERASLDPNKRVDMLEQIAQTEHDEAPAIFLYQLRNTYAVNRRVRGFTFLPNESFELAGVAVA
jgi:peptide/nickel transport system substrate-binding protein